METGLQAGVYKLFRGRRIELDDGFRRKDEESAALIDDLLDSCKIAEHIDRCMRTGGYTEAALDARRVDDLHLVSSHGDGVYRACPHTCHAGDTSVVDREAETHYV
jgi:hypothetical protein